MFESLYNLVIMQNLSNLNNQELLKATESYYTLSILQSLKTHT